MGILVGIDTSYDSTPQKVGFLKRRSDVLISFLAARRAIMMLVSKATDALVAPSEAATNGGSVEEHERAGAPLCLIRATGSVLHGRLENLRNRHLKFSHLRIVSKRRSPLLRDRCPSSINWLSDDVAATMRADRRLRTRERAILHRQWDRGRRPLARSRTVRVHRRLE